MNCISRHYILTSLLALVSLLSTAAYSQDFPAPGASLGSTSAQGFLPVREAYRPSASFEDGDLVILWQIAPDHYLYRDRTFFFSDDFDLGEPRFAEGQLIDDEFYGKPMVIYRESTEMHLPLTGERGHLRVEAQGCADAGLCYPPTDFWFALDPQEQTATYLENPPAAVTSTSKPPPGMPGGLDSFWLAGLMAFLGGLILNLMPCVFPVLAIKALKISSASESAAERFKEALAYTAGILVTVLTIAGILIAVRGAGAQVGWGFQLQSPVLVLALAALFLLIGLSFSGRIEMGARFAGLGQGLTEQGKPLRSFFTGVLAMVVASPCSAPFMAAALGYAITQPVFVSLLVFACLGLGMAAPLAAFYLVPALTRLLPRPGNWMLRLRRILAWPMYLTTLWLLWVLSAQINTTGMVLALVTLAALALAVHTRDSRQGWQRRYLQPVSYLLAAGCLVVIGMQSFQRIEQDRFQLAMLDNAVGGTRPVFVDVTADWCISCKFNEQRVLHSREIEALFADQNVHYLVADWTQENPDISALLDRYQRVGIPLYLYFPPGQSSPKILPQILTKEMLKALFQ